MQQAMGSILNKIFEYVCPTTTSAQQGSSSSSRNISSQPDTHLARSESITHDQLGRKRSSSFNDAQLSSLKKISLSSIMPDTCCCNLIPEQPFLGIEVRNIKSIFNFKERIRRGSSGTVSFATCCAHNHNSFAIKKFSESVDDDQFDEGFESNEILTCLKQIDDIHIMKFYAEYLELSPDSKAKDIRIRYLAFEYIEGFDLDTAFELITGMEGKTIHYIMNQFFEISSALETYHIYHYDLGFQNIRYCIHTRTLKVLDFGFSKFFTSRDTYATTKQHIKLFLELGKIISYPFMDELEWEILNNSMDTKQLISWIQSASEKFQTYADNPILPTPKREKMHLDWGEPSEPSILRQNQHIKRLTNDTVIEIIAWSTMIFCTIHYEHKFKNKHRFESYSKHFTVEKFRDFKKKLPPSDDENLIALYAANLEIKS